MRNTKHIVGIWAALVVFAALAIGVAIDQAQGTSADITKFISPPPVARPNRQAPSFEALTVDQRRALLSNVLPGPRRLPNEKSAVVSHGELDPLKARALVSNTPPSVEKSQNPQASGNTPRKVRVVTGVETPGGQKPYFGAARPAPVTSTSKQVKSAEETAKYRPQPQAASKYVVPTPHGPRDNTSAPSKTPTGQKVVASGDDIAHAIPVTVPASISGSTTGFTDDYDESCPWVAPGASDVVFSYTPSKIEAFSIDLCASSYDTKVYVYQDFATPGSPYACNDDWCGQNGWRSFIGCLTVYPGHTYYIVVDGYAGSSDGQDGDFQLDLTDCLLGDRIDNAIPISSLPFSDSRDTGPYFDDYDESCPYAAGGSPDVVFSYKPAEDQRIQIDLCNSQYDTKVYVYAGSVTPGSPYQCNDDYCGVDGWRSFIPCFHLSAGQTYYFVVDGFGGAAGVFDLEISECCNGLAGCSPVSPPEGETCGDNPDVTNGGCNSTGFVCSAIAPEQSVCGTVWFDLSTRDTDWYLASLSEGDSLTWCVTANFRYVAAIILWDTLQCGNPTVVSLGESDECTELCLPLKVPADAQYAFFVAPSFGSPGLNCADGPWEYNAQLHKICAPNVPASGVVFEEEDCRPDPLTNDVVNGGCNSSPEVYSPIVPGIPVWGYGSWNGEARDTDWYRLAYPLIEGDSVTWCVTANFEFNVIIVDIRHGCAGYTAPVVATGGPCDTVYAGLRIDSSGDYAFFVAPEFAGVRYLCDEGPWIYQGTLFRETACQWAGCLPGATPEGETCLESTNDTYNGGCNAGPPVFQPINAGDHICGQAWCRTDLGWRDTDWYEKVVYPGETATWSVRAQFAFEIYMIDITPGCGSYVILAGGSGDACEWVTLSYTASVKTDVAFFVAPSFFADIPCGKGPWEYDAFLDPGPTCAFPECATADVNENEPCVEDIDLFNAGCGSTPPRYTEIAVGQTFCGTSHYTQAGIDFDWYRCTLTAGQVIRYTTRASFPLAAGVFDLTSGCSLYSLIAIGNGEACKPLELTFVAPNTGEYAFALGPDENVSPPLVCEHGPWPYSGSITSCACDCAHDPRCDSVTDIFDVTLAINVAFRDAAPIADPSPICPWQRTDVDCNGHTDILDVTHLINVAFRNGNPAVEFCNPCPLVPVASTQRNSSVR
jgi:hypothetical protein